MSRMRGYVAAIVAKSRTDYYLVDTSQKLCFAGQEKERMTGRGIITANKAHLNLTPGMRDREPRGAAHILACGACGPVDLWSCGQSGASRARSGAEFHVLHLR